MKAADNDTGAPARLTPLFLVSVDSLILHFAVAIDNDKAESGRHAYQLRQRQGRDYEKPLESTIRHRRAQTPGGRRDLAIRLHR